MKILQKLEESNPFVRYAHTFEPKNKFASRLHKPYDARCFLVRSGGMELVTEAETYRLTAEQLILLPAGTAYYFAEILPKTEVIGINFDYTRTGAQRRAPIAPVPAEQFVPDRITECVEHLDFVEFNTPLQIKKATHLVALAEELEEEYCAAHTLSDMATSAQMKSILMHIAKALRAGEESSQTLERVINYIHRNYASTLSNRDIGQALNFHPNYLNRILQKNTGYTLHGYLIHYRLTVAMRLLQTTALSLGEIAEKTGFGDPQQFSKAFRRSTGHTPGDYRRIY